MKTTSPGRAGSLFASLFTLVLHSTSFGQADKDIALVLKTTGVVQLKPAAAVSWQVVTRGERLHSGDVLKTGENSLAALVFTDDKTLLKIRSNSSITLRGERQHASIAKRVVMDVGEVWVKATRGERTDLRVETPSGVAAVRGTEFYGLVDEFGNAIFFGIQGIIELINELGSNWVHADETGYLRKGEAPSVNASDPNTVPTWGGVGDQSEQELEFEFEDRDGNKKELKIRYK